LNAWYRTGRYPITSAISINPFAPATMTTARVAPVATTSPNPMVKKDAPLR
jgi:hypothetical protein